MSVSFSGSISMAQFSPGLNSVATSLSAGRLSRRQVTSAFNAVGGAGFASARASGSVSVTVPVTRTVETSRMVRVPYTKTRRVATTKQVPDMKNAGRLSVKSGQVTTPGGYKIKMKGTTAYVTAPNGKQIKVWGDPHIQHSNGKGGKQNVDFRKGTSTFVLPDGTKVRMRAYKGKKLAANGLLGNLEVYNGSKVVRMTNGRDRTGRTGKVRVSGVQTDANWRANAARRNWGDVMHVGGDGAQLIKKGRFLKHESVSGRVRKHDHRLGAKAGRATVGARALVVPKKTVQSFRTVTERGFRNKLVKDYRTITQNQTFTSNWNVGFDAGVKSGSVVGSGFAVGGGFGGFSSHSYGDFSLSAVGGAFGGAGLYGGFGVSTSSYHHNIASATGFSSSHSFSSSFNGGAVSNYISSTIGGAYGTISSYQQSVNTFF